MAGLRRYLYSFLGIHSLLIGLFLFYIPVYLYTYGYTLSSICSFIALTGAGFCLCLFFWERICRKVSLRYLVIFSFIAEFVLVSLFFLEKNMVFLVASGLCNGIFNACFWIIQRLLFLESVNQENSGEKFGNFQIFVLIILKIGIFIGGVILDTVGFIWLFCLSLLIVLAASILFLHKSNSRELDPQVLTSPPLSLKKVATFNDGFSSRWVFIIDGIYLYLESYFWVISLFLIVDKSFWKLGLLVIVLALFFGALFYCIKNSIDRLPGRSIYAAGVILYCISWILRGSISLDYGLIPLLFLLALVTFCTSMFRLTFNKRFFDLAKSSTVHEYIFLKSYYSQFSLMIFFASLAFFFRGTAAHPVGLLSSVYLLAAFFSLLYLLYIKPPSLDKSSTGDVFDTIREKSNGR